MEGRRFYFERDINSFMERPFEELEREESPGGGREEFAMLRLRLASGLNVPEFAEKFPEAPADEILRRAEFYEKPGLLKIEDETVKFTSKGFLLSNALTAELLYE